MSETILFLDDDPHRRSVFRRRHPTATIVQTVAKCIAYLAANLDSGIVWDEVWLDHDLCGETYMDSASEDSGMEVVRWIALNKPDIFTIVIHTYNELAAPLMVAALEAAGYRVDRAPFRLREATY